MPTPGQSSYRGDSASGASCGFFLGLVCLLASWIDSCSRNRRNRRSANK